MSHRERNQSPRSDQMQRVWLQDHVQEENKEMYPFDFVCMKTICENIKNDQLISDVSLFAKECSDILILIDIL